MWPREQKYKCIDSKKWWWIGKKMGRHQHISGPGLSLHSVSRVRSSWLYQETIHLGIQGPALTVLGWLSGEVRKPHQVSPQVAQQISSLCFTSFRFLHVYIDPWVPRYLSSGSKQLMLIRLHSLYITAPSKSDNKKGSSLGTEKFMYQLGTKKLSFHFQDMYTEKINDISSILIFFL